MRSALEFFINRNKATLLLMVLVLIAGSRFYLILPKESTPDVVLPIILVSTTLNGVSTEDSERLLVKPMEDGLRSAEGLKEMQSVATGGRGYLVLHFVAGFSMEKAVANARSAVDSIVGNLPAGATRPLVEEINLSLFPILSIILSGNVDVGALTELAKGIRKKVEAIPSVLSAKIANNRKDVVEIVTDPKALQSYNLDVGLMMNVIKRNNLFTPSGKFYNSGHSIMLKGALGTIDDVMDLPVKVHGEAVVTVKDVANVGVNLEDRKGFSRFNGKESVVINVSKRSGENIIDTTNQVRLLMHTLQKHFPETVKVDYLFDQSVSTENMVSDLENNVVFAMALVLVIVMAAMNFGAALMVALAIPGAFLICIIGLWIMGVTINMVVLFSLILAVGMLVDGAIVVSEYADRKMIAGKGSREAYKMASLNMLWPVVSSTATTLVVFLPLLYWPGIVGEFMKYLPLTLIGTLSGSLIVSLVFIPVLGGMFGRPSLVDEAGVRSNQAVEDGNYQDLSRMMQTYHAMLSWVLDRPIKFATFIVGTLVASFVMYAFLGRGVTFFPYMEPDKAVISLIAKGNISVDEKDNIVGLVESRMSDVRGIRGVYSVSGSFEGTPNDSIYTIGKINVEFEDWRKRDKAKAILKQVKQMIGKVPGVVFKVAEEKKGPIGGSPIDMQLSSDNFDDATQLAERLMAHMSSDPSLNNVDSNLSAPEIEWEIKFDRQKAAALGVDIQVISNYIHMLTGGLVAAKYRSALYDDELDLLIRFQEKYRTLKQLDQLFVPSLKGGVVPMSQVISKEAVKHTIRIDRNAQVRVVNIKADVATGALVDHEVQKIKDFLANNPELSEKAVVKFKGESEDQEETRTFLMGAFVFSLLGIMMILMLEFNNFYYAFVIMTAIFLSTAGVIMGLVISGQVFGIVMCGAGIITLAGVVVNNNILLIDAFQSNVAEGLSRRDAVVKSAISRLRPILLTSGTTVTGLLPMMLGMNIDFFDLDLTFDSPSSQLWKQISVTVAGGLSFATILTLFLTPALLSVRK